MSKEDDPLSLSIPSALFGEPPPSSKVFSFEFRLKPEENEEKKSGSQKLKHSPWGGELEGPLQVAQAWQLVLGLWKPLTEAKIQEASPSTQRACGSVELGHQCQLTAPLLTAHRGSAQWLFLSASAHIQSRSADSSWSRGVLPWVKPSGTLWPMAAAWS